MSIVLTSVDPLQFFNPRFERHCRMILPDDVPRVENGQDLFQRRRVDRDVAATVLLMDRVQDLLQRNSQLEMKR